MRLEFPVAVKRAVRRRADGRCEKCGAVLKPTEGEVDHRLSDGLGGKPVLVNAWLLCRVCHAPKTAEEVGRMRKADRQRNDRRIVKPKTAAIPQRPKEEKGSPKLAQIQALPRRVLYGRGELSMPIGGETDD